MIIIPEVFQDANVTSARTDPGMQGKIASFPQSSQSVTPGQD